MSQRFRSAFAAPSGFVAAAKGIKSAPLADTMKPVTQGASGAERPMLQALPKLAA